MATATTLVITWEDSTGRTAQTRHYFEPTSTYAQIKEVAKDAIQKEENLTDCMFVSAKVEFPVEFGWFGGLTVDEVAVVLGVTPRTIALDWRAARAWLRQALEDPRQA